MEQKRRHKRYRKRLETKVSSGSREFNAITSDVSRGGLFVRTMRCFTPGSVVDIELYLPGGKTCYVRGIVRHAFKTDIPSLKNGMGIELLDTGKNLCYLEFLDGFAEGVEPPGTAPPKSVASGQERERVSSAGGDEGVILVCSSCKAKNRVLKSKLSLGPKCGKCGTPLATGHGT